MCLATTQIKPYIADSDISCYKILVPVSSSNYITPYRDFSFPLNTIITDSAEEHIVEVFGMTMIESGYFHTFNSKERVLEEIEILRRKSPKMKLKVFKAIIPKGSNYYVGLRSDLCSSSLMIIDHD